MLSRRASAIRYAVQLAGLFSASPDLRRRYAAGLLAAALTLHDLEEAIGYPLQRRVILDVVPLAPSVAIVWTALVVVTAVGVAAALWAGSGTPMAGKVAVLRLLAAILLANVLIPHVPAAWRLGGYAPGVITAVAVNLPVCLLALMLLRTQPART
jgi:hypothetical protein